MNKYFVSILILTFLLIGGIADAGQFWGSPEPLAKKGKFSLGVGYLYTNDTIVPESPLFLETSTFVILWDEAEIEQNQIYVEGSYGFFDGAEVFLRVGVADVESDEAFLFGSDFDDSFGVFGTLGVRMVRNITDIWGVGAYAQGSVYSTYEDEKTELVNLLLLNGTVITDVPVTQKIETDSASWEINLGVALQANVDIITFYAGPFVYWQRIPDVVGTISIDDARVVTAPLTVESSTGYQEDVNGGGFAGIALNVGNGVRVQIEGQLRSRLSAGGSVGFSF
jgi:hypothetical protein